MVLVNHSHMLDLAKVFEVVIGTGNSKPEALDEYRKLILLEKRVDKKELNSDFELFKKIQDKLNLKFTASAPITESIPKTDMKDLIKNG